jgi:DNA topoisomerase-1
MLKKSTKNTSINVLVIVESPAKCKKIEAYLGPGYKVLASFGHLRTLDGLESIDIQNGFKPTYKIIQEQIKLKQIEKLRSEISNADEVILATDSDREGEGIAWHICDLFSLSIEKTKRIVFNEVTEQALQTAIRNPTHLNMDLIHAQQSRQILDLLVGFTITPYLWQCVSKNSKNSLSAGRCQTPALKLVYDNHLEIQESPGSFIYNTGGYFTNMNLLFELNKQFETKEDVMLFLEHCKTSTFLCSTTSPKKSIRKAPEPLTTSALQQMASNELHISPKDTMKYAQELYEGGYITYMRTDSKKYSGDFIAKTRQYIESIYGQGFVSPNIDLLAGDIKKDKSQSLEKDKSQSLEKDKSQSLAQEAHEAIRPVSINTISVTEPSAKAQKLYALIWARTLESCMAAAQYNTITAKINLEPPFLYKKDNCEFSYKTEQVTFAGWQIVEGVKPTNLVKEYQYFSAMKKSDKGLLVVPKKIDCKFNLINLKSHYTEARLVQLLEEKGIGRPSTFASLIDKIQEREYVKKQNIEGRKIESEDFLLVLDKKTIETIPTKREFGNETNKLVIQPLGIIVIEFLLKHFESFFNYDYTKDMENALDLIASNKLVWTTLCDECYNSLISITKDLKNETKFSLKIDDIHTLIIGKYGPVIKRQIEKSKDVTFIPVKKDLDISQAHLLKLEDMIETKQTSINANGLIGKYKGEDLFIKKGKYGLYAQWSKDGKQETKNLKELEGKTIDQIEYLDVLRILEKETTLDPERPVGFVRELSSTLSIRTGKFGDYIFYKKPRVKTPQFFKLKDFNGDARKCEKDVLLNWIKLTYNVE